MNAIFSAPSRVLAWLSSPARLPLIDRLDLRAPLPLKGAVFSFPDALADLRKPLPSPEASLATAIAQDEARLAHLADEGWEYEAIAVDKPARKPRARKPALTAEQKAERMAKALAKATAPKAPRKSRKATETRVVN